MFRYDVDSTSNMAAQRDVAATNYMTLPLGVSSDFKENFRWCMLEFTLGRLK